MGVDLLRQAQKWKDGLMDIRQLMANLVTQVSGSLCPADGSSKKIESFSRQIT